MYCNNKTKKIIMRQRMVRKFYKHKTVMFVKCMGVKNTTK